MTEPINPRGSYKAMLFPYDVFIPDESRECQYCLTANQAMLLRGLLEPMGWPTRWWSDETEIDKDTIEAFRDDLIRRLMMSCCGSDFDIIFQWTEAGVLQKSEDGGATWEDSPQDDPRNSSTVYPPTEGSPSPDKKCIAATGAVALIKEQVGDQLTDDMSRYTLGQLINDWVTTYIQTSNPLEALVNIVKNQLFALVIAVLRPALTDDVYHTLVCILDCNMAEDLSFNDAQWAQVREDILAQITGIAGVFFEHLVFLIGKVGITNLARAQAATEGDCSSCECSDQIRVFIECEGGVGGTEISWDGTILEASSHNNGGTEYIYFIFQDETCGGDHAAFTCGQLTVEENTSLADFAAYVPCGSSSQVSPGLTPPNELCASQIVFSHSSPFTMKVSAIACP